MSDSWAGVRHLQPLSCQISCKFKSFEALKSKTKYQLLLLIKSNCAKSFLAITSDFIRFKIRQWPLFMLFPISSRAAELTKLMRHNFSQQFLKPPIHPHTIFITFSIYHHLTYFSSVTAVTTYSNSSLEIILPLAI